jgi:hypothetical protein
MNDGLKSGDSDYSAHSNVPTPSGPQLQRLRKLRPETRDPILNRLRELQAKIAPRQLSTHALWLLYLEAADQIIQEIPGRINPLLLPEKMLLFLVDLQNQLQN